MANVLFILSNYNIYGGTPKKTIDLLNHFKKKSFLYVYENSYPEFKSEFQNTGTFIFEGFYGKNLYLHIKSLLDIVDKYDIKIIQTQFFWGELLGYLIKQLRPKTRIIVAFVGSLHLTVLKSAIAKRMYQKFDYVIYISNYVKTEKEKQFPELKNQKSSIIYNGTEKRVETKDRIDGLKQFAILDIAGLIELKNIQILVKAFNIIVNQNNKVNFYLYVAGEGPYRSELEKMIDGYKLQDYIFLLGYQKNVGRLLNSCDIFVHPSYAEGFGIVVSEAMLAQKPIIVSNAGALPEIIEHEKTGLIVEPYSAVDWANAIIQLAENPKFAEQLAKNAEKSASERFSYNKFCGEYEKLYNNLLEAK